MRTILCTLLLACCAAHADTDVSVLAFNTQFFFDHQAPHGNVVGSGPDHPIPTEAQWKDKAQGIADLINNSGANIVGLVEVENEAVVEDLRGRLTTPTDWNLIFVTGRDTATGQDVALLTQFNFDADSVTNFPDEREVYFQGNEERDVNPSKILAATLTIGGERVYVLVAHLISRASPNDAKRLAQANIIRRHAVRAMLRDEHVIVMGDINDTPGTPVVNRLRGFDDIWGDMVQTAHAVPEAQRFTYDYNGELNLLDHVLLSPSLRNEHRRVPRAERCEIIDVGDLSDHHALLARLRFID